MIRTLILAAGVLAAASPAWAQQDNEALKRKILEDVEKRLKADEQKLLKDLERIIDEELKRSGKAPAARPAPQDPAAKPAPNQPAPKSRGYLGVRPGDLTAEEKQKLGLKNGIRVVEVVPGGPAEKGGLKEGDVIVAIDGRDIDSPQEVPSLVQAAGAGATLKVDVLRDGKRSTLPLVLGRHPLDGPEPPAPDKDQGKSEEELRERVKKFLDKKKAEEPKAEGPKPPAEPKDAPDEDGLFAFDEEMFEQFRSLFEQFGMEPDQFFEKGKDGKYRFNDDWKRLFKDLDFERFFKNLPGLPGQREPGGEEPAPRPRARAVPPPPALKVWLGVQGEDVPDELRSHLQLGDQGVLVTQVSPGSPAEKAGFQKNDVILKADGQPMKGRSGMYAFMKDAKKGQEVAFTVLRKGKEQTLKATLVERSDE